MTVSIKADSAAIAQQYFTPGFVKLMLLKPWIII